MRLDIVIFRSLCAVVVGLIIGAERSFHGRAAGMRTHILVCLGAAITSMTGIFVFNTYGIGDVFRLSAQVVSGIGFLGAGMIILKNDNMITGLTTAAGVWATATVGIAIGYGFYWAAAISCIMFMITLILFAKFERKKKNTKVTYLEISDMSLLNHLMDEIKNRSPKDVIFRVLPSKSGCEGHIGLEVVSDRRKSLPSDQLLNLEGVVFAVEN